MKHRHKIVLNAELFVTCVAFFSARMSTTAKTNLVLSFSLCKIAEKPRNVCNRCVVVFPIEQICDALVVFAANNQRMSSAAFVIKTRKHIYIYLKLIFIQVNIVE